MRQSAMGYRLVMVLAVLCLAVPLVACGDDDTEGGEADNQAQDQEPNNQEPNGDECPEGETPNPITGECVPAANNDAPGDNGTPGDNDEPDENDGPDENDEPTENQEELECGPGGLTGQTCRPDGGAIPGATVTIEGFDCDGAPFSEETTADAEGYYDFDGIPAGDHTVTITSGSFEAEEDVTIFKGQITDRESIGEKICLTGEEVDIAIIEGGWDDVGDILDGLGIEYDTYSGTGSLLGDLGDMNEYEIIFVECVNGLTSGAGFTLDDMQYNVRRFVEEGGSLYASDRAYDVIRDSVPEAMDFWGGPDGNPVVGASGQTVTADVVSDTMQSILGSTTAEIYFDTGLAMLEGASGPDNTIHFQATVDLSSGDQDQAELPLMADYQDPLGNGYLIFTSFHNTDDTTDDMDQILEYMIFQL